ncbi:MAG: glycosyltransferase family 39 protein [Desulfuromonadaceae bacterium]|nr:glycosyltransferase family 39 protein [Desulfuromonadaceae bacterium]
MNLIKQLWLPFVIIAFPGVLFSLFLPFFPVDETRYLSVAWEMNLHNSFVVPLQNALPYSHKPPFLFWLFNLDWLLFGINEVTLRLIPVIFSLFNITLTYKISLLLWDDEEIAQYAAIILSSTLSYLLWSSLIMFDVVLTFWILLAIFGFLSAEQNAFKSWLLAGLAIGGGILTKGPVILVYILPVAIFSFVWIPQEKFTRKWYAWLGLSFCIGLAIVLLWLIPAALTGGETYRNAILWGQTVNRMAKSFAHQRPVWWYLPWLLALLLPWVLVKPVWCGWSRLKHDTGCRFLVLWIVPSFVILSLLSGKQVHYLIPLLPAFSLLMAKNIVSSDSSGKITSCHYLVAAFYSLLGIAILLLTFMRLTSFMENFGVVAARSLSCGLITIGIALFLVKKQTAVRSVTAIAVSSVVFLVVIVFSGQLFFERYDIRPISQLLNEKQKDGFSILHHGKYHGQFQFLGRLTQPLVSLESKKEIGTYAASHEKVALITYESRNKIIKEEDIYFQQPFRSKKVVLWNKKGIAEFIAVTEENLSQETE